jgi:hypothetical protein
VDGGAPRGIYGDSYCHDFALGLGGSVNVFQELLRGFARYLVSYLEVSYYLFGATRGKLFGDQG